MEILNTILGSDLLKTVSIVTALIAAFCTTIYKIWQFLRNRRRIKIHTINFCVSEIYITLENIGPDTDSISKIKSTGICCIDLKQYNANFEPESHQILTPNTKINIIAKSLGGGPFPDWFVTIKISFTKARTKKIRLRHAGDWPKNHISMIKFLVEKQLYKHCKHFYRKYIYDFNKRNE